MTGPGAAHPGRGGRLATLLAAVAACSIASSPAETAPGSGRAWHTDIPVTTFWVGEIFAPHAPDGSQERSAYDARWLESYGGCDGVVREGRCETERRFASTGWFPRRMTPRENPFYLDVPYDDVSNHTGFARRCEVVPWADDPGYAGRCSDRDFSYLKNRWVRMIGPAGRDCFGQVQDAGPGEYTDAAYVFGDHARPRNDRYGGAGMDVSPALTGCLGLADANGAGELVDWRFVEESEVPPGPWRRIVTTSGVTRPSADHHGPE